VETVQQVISGVYTLLRRPSELKLHPDDVKDLLNDDLRGRVQDIDLTGREQRTESKEVAVDADDYDYRIRMSTIPDFEATKLEYCAPVYANTEAWSEVLLMNQAVWKTHYSWQDKVIGSFYGSLAVQDGCRLKLNLDPSVANTFRWRLTYRVPFLRIVQEGERPPIPANFLPLLKTAVALKAIPIVQDNSPEWNNWTAKIVPIYSASLAQWEERWRTYLDTSVEPPTQPIKPFNHFRRHTRRTTRGYLPWQ
jgi:hypothetical protein